MSVEEFEKIYDDHQEQLAIHEEEIKIFGQVLDNDAIDAELDELVAAESGPAIPDAAVGYIAPVKKPVVQEQVEEEEEDEVEKRLAAAM